MSCEQLRVLLLPTPEWDASPSQGYPQQYVAGTPRWRKTMWRKVPCHAVMRPGGGGGLPYENDGDARRKISIKPLKETNLGVVQALFDS